MSKKKVILGVFIMMAMAICGVFLTKIQPQVFASEISANQNQEVVTKAGANAETIINEAGIFIGQGYYEINQHAKLIAQMNDGYAFVGWYVAGTETCLSTQSEYTFVVTSNMTIEFRWRKIEYQILFADDMWKSHNVELKDFTYTIQNRTEEGRNKYYYSDMVDVVLETKEDSFIAEFNPSNVTINGVASTSLRFAGAAIEHDSIEGVTKVTISLGIDKEIINNEKIVIDIDYVNMYKFTIKSANSIGIGNLMQFITLNDAVKNRVLDENNYVYLVRADQLVTITNTLGNDVYQFVTTQFTGYEPTTSRINSYTLYRHSELLVNYSAILYTMNFGSYLKNEHNNYDAMSEFPYVIGDMGIVAGEQVTFDYNDENRKITITNSQGDSVVYNYDENIYGYQFAGFAVNKEILTDNTYTLSTTEPINVEIQLIFESIKYKVEVILIDEYFESGVTYQKEYNDIIKNTTINLTAETNIYLINGWSDNANPKVNGYLQQATDGTKKDTYSFKFEPTTDDNSIVYTIYLDVDYEYISVEYALNKSSIKQNVDYNVITWDR